MGLVHSRSSRRGTAQLLAFKPFSNAAQRVLLRFDWRENRWFCDFYEASGIARIRQTLTYRSSERVVSLAMRGGATMDGDSRFRLYRGIQVGHGSILLNLTSEQYNKLIAA